MTRSHVTILLILGRGGLLLVTARRGGALLHTPRNGFLRGCGGGAPERFFWIKKRFIEVYYWIFQHPGFRVHPVLYLLFCSACCRSREVIPVNVER